MSLASLLSLALFTRNALFTNTRNISTTTVARTRTFACRYTNNQEYCLQFEYLSVLILDLSDVYYSQQFLRKLTYLRFPVLGKLLKGLKFDKCSTGRLKDYLPYFYLEKSYIWLLYLVRVVMFKFQLRNMKVKLIKSTQTTLNHNIVTTTNYNGLVIFTLFAKAY